MTDCERCGQGNGEYECKRENDMGDLISMKLCWNCEHDVSNGGSLFDDTAEVLMERQQNAYEYDPINNSPPGGTF